MAKSEGSGRIFISCAKFIEFTNFQTETKLTGGGLTCLKTCSELLVIFICKIFNFYHLSEISESFLLSF